MKKRILKSAIVVAIIYIIAFLFNTFIFTEKLSKIEVDEIQNFYNSMVARETIKSDLYVNNLIKVLDREYILDELIEDSLKYSVYLIDTSFQIYTEGEKLDSERAVKYLERNDLDFDKFMGLEIPEKLVEETKMFFYQNFETVESIGIYDYEIEKNIAEISVEIKEKESKRTQKNIIILLSYIVVTGIVVYFPVENLKKFRR